MVLTRESVLSLLIAEGGKIKKSDLVDKFKASIDCDDPAEKERNKELFKTCVNKVAVVKEIHGVRYVVVKKIYQHLLDGAQTAESRAEDTDIKEESPLTAGEQRSEETRGSGDAAGERSAVSEPDREQAGESGENAMDSLTPIELALRNCKYKPGKVKRVMSFEIQRQEEAHGDNGARRGAFNQPTVAKSKPYGLPLRGPPCATLVEIRKLKVDPDEPPGSVKLDSFGSKRRPSSVETSAAAGSPQLRRPAKSHKEPEEPNETRFPSLVPLEQSEHEWLVKCAAGLWSQVYGLLLRDSQLAEKRDFMSGFTALHWAAKCGNSEMLVKIIDLSRQGGVGVDINAKTHGGYTPLHIAALHDQEFIMAMLVREFRADPSIRDNCGKRAYHYLHKGISATVREMLAKPKDQEPQDRAQHDKEELDLFPDLPKGLHSISRLFQPHVMGHKKKHKQRPTIYSMTDEPSEDLEDSSFRQRAMSDAFM